MTGQPEQRPLIVCVDDDQAQLWAYEGFLADLGEVATVASGEAAIAVLEERVAQLIILDVMMPEMSGFEVARHIRRNIPRQDGTPILFVTALDGLPNQQEAMKSGGDDFLTKPVGFDQLRLRVAMLLQVYGIDDPLRRNNTYLRLIHTNTHA